MKKRSNNQNPAPSLRSGPCRSACRGSPYAEDNVDQKADWAPSNEGLLHIKRFGLMAIRIVGLDLAGFILCMVIIPLKIMIITITFSLTKMD